MKLLPLRKPDCKTIVEWNQGKNEDFLRQWAGTKVYTFPLTTQQIENRLKEKDVKLFKITLNNQMIGFIEFSKENNFGKISRFLINEEFTGKGYGEQVLLKFINYTFKKLHLPKLKLKVFSYNTKALKCYEKVGFAVENLEENTDDPKWNVYTMSIENGNHCKTCSAERI